MLALGVACALIGNVDSINIVKWLWNSNAARQSVVSAAIEISKNRPQTQKDSSSANPFNTLAADMGSAAREFEVLQLPIGWPTPHHFSGSWLLQFLVGCLLMGIAVSVGSSFWFDALQGLVKIRATGPRPGGR